MRQLGNLTNKTVLGVVFQSLSTYEGIFQTVFSQVQEIIWSVERTNLFGLFYIADFDIGHCTTP